MSAVNAQISRSGLQSDTMLRPLVSDLTVSHRHPKPAPAARGRKSQQREKPVSCNLHHCTHTHQST